MAALEDGYSSTVSGEVPEDDYDNAVAAAELLEPSMEPDLAHCAAAPEVVVEDIRLALEDLKQRNYDSSCVCHGWDLSYRLRLQFVKKGGTRGDITAIDPRDGEKLHSLPAIKRKLGLQADAAQLDSLHNTQAQDNHEQELLAAIQEGGECFARAGADNNEWFRAKLLNIRARPPRFYVEFVSSLAGKVHGLPHPRHIQAAHIRLDEPPPLPTVEAPVEKTGTGRRKAAAAGPGGAAPASSRKSSRSAMTEWPATRIDSKLGRGAAALGWRVTEKCHGSQKTSHWLYISPNGLRFAKMREALAHIAGGADGDAEGGPAWLERREVGSQKEVRVGRDYQAEIAPITVPSVKPFGQAAPPHCFCARPAVWLRKRWWCADEDRGCGFEVTPPPFDMTPSCLCNTPAVWVRRDELWRCMRIPSEGGCQFASPRLESAEPSVEPPTELPSEPTLCSLASIESASAERVAAALTAAAYHDAPTDAGWH